MRSTRDSWRKSKKDNRGGKNTVDTSCHNHGSCEWCRRNRTHKNIKREQAAKEDMRV